MTPHHDTALDIDRLRSHLIASERIAGMGSWSGTPGTNHRVYWSPQCYEIMGVSPDTEISFELFLEMVHPDDRAGYLAMRERALEGADDYAETVRVVLADGRIRHLELRADVVERGGRSHLVGVVWDRTTAHALRSRLQDIDRMRGQLLDHALREADHDHRLLDRRLGEGPLHDLSTVVSNLRRWSDCNEGLGELEATLGLMEASIEGLRHTVVGVRALPGDERELTSLMEDAARQAGSRTIPTVSVSSDHLAGLKEELAWVLVQIAREAVTNACKHAGATQVCVDVRLTEDEIELVVRDDGRGFERGNEPEPGHFGVHVMHQRADAVGGRLEINSGSAGTTIRALLPLR